MQVQVIAHNLLSQYTNRQLKISSKKKESSIGKLASGYRINRAADDAAGLSISEKMRSQIRGLERGKQNTQDGISWLQVGDGAMKEIMEITQRIRELAVQASNGTNRSDELFSINQEIKQLKVEINRISASTEFNTQPVFDKAEPTLDVQGQFDDLQTYNSSYDDTTGRAEYGGFVFNGYRVPWDTVSTGMVEFDTNGNQVFVGGNYTYQEPNTGTLFHFTCDDGAQVPKITRTISITADGNGISIDGMKYGWGKFRNENGNPPRGGVFLQKVSGR